MKQKELKIKVCGMRDAKNIAELAELQPDYMGFIFFPESKRFAGDVDKSVLYTLPSFIKRTGVFVDERADFLLPAAEIYHLDAIQLHGAETPEYCQQVKDSGFEVIKAFGVDENFDFSILQSYRDVVDFFLFDTKTPQHGGSGRAFNWKLLEKNQTETPYFLSGGLDLDSLDDIDQIHDDRLYALDVNSRFEIDPALKDIKKLNILFKYINKYRSGGLEEL